MKIGDKVRFIHDTGGGRVAGFQNRETVLVEDEDGFQIPASIRDVVVVNTEDYGNDSNSSEIDEEPYQKPAPQYTTHLATPPSAMPQRSNHAVEERKGGDTLTAFMAFVPKNIREFSQTTFDVYLINDCNYFFTYTIASLLDNDAEMVAEGEIEPNTKVWIKELKREEMNGIDAFAVQMVPYKREKSYKWMPAVDSQVKVDGVKFCKLHVFGENDFFDEKALISTIIENGTMPKAITIDSKRLEESMREKQREDIRKPQPSRVRDKNESLIVDLHAGEILDNMNGLTPLDILKYQLEIVERTLKENKNNRGLKIVFIHGKGAGVLRQQIIQMLTRQYKHLRFKDASFQKYGYGATEVTM